jgi:hypothetical protein
MIPIINAIPTNKKPSSGIGFGRYSPLWLRKTRSKK